MDKTITIFILEMFNLHGCCKTKLNLKFVKLCFFNEMEMIRLLHTVISIWFAWKKKSKFLQLFVKHFSYKNEMEILLKYFQIKFIFIKRSLGCFFIFSLHFVSKLNCFNIFSSNLWIIIFLFIEIYKIHL